ncbi:MAG TPA: hypothetical protein VFD99_11545 [Arthrobacter sp.]|jgi:hypothetical protein|nr:hypothetical protein [Arthrobacter sp.]
MGLTAELPSKRQFLDVGGVGEALIDAVTSPEGTSEHPGGSPANVAYGRGRLALITKVPRVAARHSCDTAEHSISEIRGR